MFIIIAKIRIRINLLLKEKMGGVSMFGESLYINKVYLKDQKNILII